VVRALARDAEGRIWAGTEAGACRFDNGTWTTFDTSNSSLPDKLVRAIATEASGRIWFATDGGLAMLYGQEWQALSMPPTYENSKIHCLATLPSALDNDPSPGPLWVGTEQGALYYDGSVWTTYAPGTSGLIGSTVLSIVSDSYGRVWFGTWGGLSSFDGTTWTSFTRANSGLVYDTVSSIVLDAEGRVWCGTLDGISVLDNGTWRSYTLANSSLRFNTATVLAVDARGNIWMGGDLPVGPMGAAAVFDGENWTDHSQFFTGPHPAPVRAILAEPTGSVWFGTLLEGIVVYDPDAAAERAQSDSVAPR
jgi:ligand-binding sensor domain-containing protein